jgi:putative ABC transport system ATP-binding protein
MIEFRDVTKVFGALDTSVRAVNGLSFSCPRGGFWAITGPSGCGKSTVLHMIAGLTVPTSGTVLVDGLDVASMTPSEAAALRRRRIGYIMQTFNLLPYLTVEENVSLPLLVDGVPFQECRDRAAEAMALATIVQRAAHSPSHLSGGEQQRVAIARALVIQPSIILADEPTGNLDQANGRVITDLIQSLNASTGVTVLLVTHDPVFAERADRVLRLIDGTLQRNTASPEGESAIAGERPVRES